MSNRAKTLVKEMTRELNAADVQRHKNVVREVNYRKVPDQFTHNEWFWRLRLELAYDMSVSIGLDVYDEVHLGRGKYSADFVGLLSEEEAAQMGVSRRHAALRPTQTALYLVDHGSTNGTRLNGHLLGPNIPYRLHDGDSITFGHLDFVLRVVRTPDAPVTARRIDLMEIVPEITVAITGCLEHREVLEEAMAQVCAHTVADTAAVWLVDEQTGELYLEASTGKDTGSAAQNPVQKVIQTGQLMLERPDTAPMIYAPMKLGGMTFGVLSAILNTPDSHFEVRDQRLIEFIAGIAATALQNARMYQSKKAEIRQYRRVMSLLKDALTFNLKGKLNNIIGYTGILRDQLPEDLRDLGSDVLLTSEYLMHYSEQLAEVIKLSESKSHHRECCDLVEMVQDACEAMRPFATDRGVKLAVALSGEPNWIDASDGYLYRTITGLIENGICNSPPDETVQVRIAFHGTVAVLTISDRGAAFKDRDTAHMFDAYGGGLRGTPDDERVVINLEIAYITARMHRGSLNAENLADGGVAFSLKMPVHIKE